MLHGSSASASSMRTAITVRPTGQAAMYSRRPSSVLIIKARACTSTIAYFGRTLAAPPIHAG
jgi:hypothetical protein